MIIKSALLFFALTSCQDTKVKTEKDLNLQTDNVTMNRQMMSEFSGNFSGVNNDKEILVTLKPILNTKNISGVLLMDNQKAQIAAIENNGFIEGKITEEGSQKTYAITAEIKEGQLYFNITFPEFNNQILALVLKKNSSNENVTNINPNASSSSSNSSSRDNATVGKWRFTEVFSSGSGEFYASMSTDYFIKINGDGTATTWTGKSAGGSNTVIIEGDYGTNVKQYKWFTNDKNFHFIDIETNEEQVVNYYAEPALIMFSFENNKRVYQRIN